MTQNTTQFESKHRVIGVKTERNMHQIAKQGS